MALYWCAYTLLSTEEKIELVKKHYIDKLAVGEPMEELIKVLSSYSTPCEKIGSPKNIHGRYLCEECPLYKDLRKTLNYAIFLKMSTRVCHFESGFIGSYEFLSDSLKNGVYRNMTPIEMLDYADKLETELELYKESVLRKRKDPLQRNLIEVYLLEAINWLRVCAKYDLHSVAYY